MGAPRGVGQEESLVSEAEQAPRRATIERLFASLVPPLARWAHGRLPRHARRRCDSWDLVQDACSGVLRNLPEIDVEQPAKVHAYLQQSIRNRIRDEVRRSGIGETASSDGLRAVDDRPSPFDETRESEERRRFRLALLELSEGEQLLVVGRVELGLDYEEIARVTGRTSAEGARRACSRAMLALARKLGAIEERERALRAAVPQDLPRRTAGG